MIQFPLAITAIEDDCDRAFMERLYIQHWRLMYRTAYRMMQEHFAAEDIVILTSEALCHRIPFLRTLSGVRLKAYVVVASRHTALNQLRQRQRDSELLFDQPEMIEAIPDGEDAATSAMRRIELDELREGLNRLPAREQDLLRMKYLLQKRDAEIAEVYGIQPASVRFYLTRARRRLADTLEGGDD